MRTFRYIKSVKELRENVNRLPKLCERDTDFWRRLFQHPRSEYWLFDPRTGNFGPNKWAVFWRMSAADYENCVRLSKEKQTLPTEGQFNGTAARKHIESRDICGSKYVENLKLKAMLPAWADRMVGQGAMDRVNKNKWKFLELEHGPALPPDDNDAIFEIEEAAVAVIEDDRKLSETAKKQLIKARLGQGQFRKKLVALWDGKCCLTGCDTVELLRASHIKPWRDCDNSDRLNEFNGLLLTPNADVLFDKGFITFTDDGEIKISRRLTADAKDILLRDCERRIEIFEENKPYLQYHRKHRFQR